MSKLYVNTDAVNIRNSSIGIQGLGLYNRELTIEVKHLGTKESVEKATKYAKMIVDCLNSLDDEIEDPNPSYTSMRSKNEDD